MDAPKPKREVSSLLIVVLNAILFLVVGLFLLITFFTAVDKVEVTEDSRVISNKFVRLNVTDIFGYEGYNTVRVTVKQNDGATQTFTVASQTSITNVLVGDKVEITAEFIDYNGSEFTETNVPSVTSKLNNVDDITDVYVLIDRIVSNLDYFPNVNLLILESVDAATYDETDGYLYINDNNTINMFADSDKMNLYTVTKDGKTYGFRGIKHGIDAERVVASERNVHLAITKSTVTSIVTLREGDKQRIEVCCGGTSCDSAGTDYDDFTTTFTNDNLCSAANTL